MDKGRFDKYIDGVVKICLKKNVDTDFSAAINTNTKEDLTPVYKMNYEQLSKRNQDFEFAKQSGFSLTMKIKIRKVNGVTAKHSAVINNYLYSIKYIDSDTKNLYLYLEGERSLAK